MMPTKADLATLEGLSEHQIHEVAEAYLDLFGLLLDALNECDHNPGVLCQHFIDNENGHCCREYSGEHK